MTDFDGQFKFLGLAPGRYQVRLDAPGAAPWLRELEVGVQPVELEMEALSRAARVAVRVVDAISGRALPGVQLQLAEVWPGALLGDARTDASGAAVFAELALGSLNWRDAQDRVGRSRGPATLHAELEGYEASVMPVVLGVSNEPVEVRLNPLTLQREQEPNNDLASAQPIRTGAPVQLAIEPVGDVDVFAFRLQHPAEVSLRIAAGGGIQTLLTLFDGEGNRIADKGAQAGIENLISGQVLVAGRYFVEVSEWGRDAASAEPLQLTVEATPAVDPREPNDSLAEASPLALLEQASGLTWPRGDRDRYRIELPRPGVLQVEEAGADYQRKISLLDLAGATVGDVGAQAGRPARLVRELPAGVYFIEIGEWGDDAVSRSPYRLTHAFMPDDDVGEVGGAVAPTTRRLALGSAVGATLLPSVDRDDHALEIPSAGILQVRARAHGQLLLRVLDAQETVLKDRGTQPGVSNEVAVFFDAPTRATISLEEWGRDGASPVAYALQTWFVPADQGDVPTRNDDFDHATPVASGETLSGTYLPLGDVDFHAIDIELPGHLSAEATSAHQTLLQVFDQNREKIADRGAQDGKTAALRVPVGPGRYFIVVSEWGNDKASAHPYTLSVRHEPAEPGEGWPLQDAQPRPLIDGVAQSFAIDQMGDVDRFSFEMVTPGTLTLSLAGPLQKLLQVFDARTGARLLDKGFQPSQPAQVALEFDAPTPLIVEVREWGDNDASLTPLFILADTRGRGVAAEQLTWKPDPADPSHGWFERSPVTHAAEVGPVGLDLDLDGKPELTLTGPQSARIALPATGLQRAEAQAKGAEGQQMRQLLWLDGRGPQAREGVRIALSGIAEGERLSAPAPLSVLVSSYNNARIERLEARLNGRLIEASGAPPFELPVNWSALPPGASVLELSARDSLGSEATLTRRFQLSEYFDLSPQDGAMLTAETPLVSWQGQDFGPARIRFRPKPASGEATGWVELEGESGRQRRVRLPPLEHGVPYEFQPLGGVEPGPVRTLTRVKGLAFSQSSYAANIQRDYDQRVAVAVRNNGDQPLQVRLESGLPADPDLLASFVGTGSEDKPFELAPGESRAFQFAISAQNVNAAEHRIPLRIVSDTGLSDESELLVHVRLPHVELQWQDLGPAGSSHGRRLRLRNLGDTLTDVSVEPLEAHALIISPTVRHGLLRRGGHLDFVVTPRFHEGFKGITTVLRASVLDQHFDHEYRFALAPGQSMHRVWLTPGLDPLDPAAQALEAQLPERVAQAAAVDLDRLDWSQSSVEAGAGDGAPAPRRVLWQDGIEWVGSDHDGDGRMEHVFADVGRDGVSEFAAVRAESGWRPTNLVEAWLEMSFALRGSRDSYKPHDVEVVLNGQTLGMIKDTLPEGNFSFPIPPALIRFDPSGLPGDNRVGLRTTHLRGGHYVVNSDFRFKFRLTATPVWAVAQNQAEARQQAMLMSGVSLTAPDLSVSAAQLQLDHAGELAAGDAVSLRVPVRNFGARPARDVEVVLMRILPDGSRVQLAQTRLAEVGATAPAEAALSWPVNGGLNRLALVVDPEQRTLDPDLANNEALFMLSASGDNTPPAVRILSPASGAVLDRTVVMLEFEVDDDAGPVAPLLAINGGLWHELAAAQGRVSVPLLLQPGTHLIELRVVDGAGNENQIALPLEVRRALPQAQLLAPAAGARTANPVVVVEVAVPPDVGLAAARVSGGPWHKASLLGDMARVEVPLRFGEQRLEVMITDRHGAVRMLESTVTRTSQAQPGERIAGAAAADQGLLWPEGHPQLEIDLFQGSSGVLRTLALAPANEAVRLWEEARRRQAQGDYAGALTLYRDSLMLKPDPQTDDRVRRLEAYLGIRRINPGAPR